MNRILLAAALSLAACSVAHADDAVSTLKSECAAKHSTKADVAANASGEYHFVYSKGEYRGEAQAGKDLPCTERQYVAYLETVSPDRVMSAYPTAAGRPAAKDAKDAKDQNKK